MILWLISNYNPSAYVRAYGHSKYFKSNRKIMYLNFSILNRNFRFLTRPKNLLQYIFIIASVLINSKIICIIERDLPKVLLYILKILKNMNKVKCKIYYDFDDAMWINDFIGITKFESICSIADELICDNDLQMKILKKELKIKKRYIFYQECYQRLKSTKIHRVEKSSDVKIWVTLERNLPYIISLFISMS